MKTVTALAAVLLAAGSPVIAAPAHKAPAKPAAVARVVLPTAVAPERYDIRVTPDAQKLTFQGQARIAVVVKRATDRIVLNAADLTIQKVSLSGRPAAPRIVLDDAQQTAAFVFAKPLTPGRYVLSIDYAGKIFTQASGLFALDYDGAKGKQRALFTQFENSDARRFAPMWDEPGVKSVFALTVEAPADQMAISNMPVAKTTALPGGRQAVTFADSPKMSSYLLFLGLGDFERIHRQVGKTDVGVVVRRGDTAKGEFALDAAVKILGYYNDYFGTPYPLPKLDLVAGPGQSQFFGAMENWGAIFYFDYYLLLDPKLSTEHDRQQVFVVIAHEMAHQWFGDLVTMAWWDDLWLNEGFASWMENKATDHFHPEWKMWLQTQSGQQAAMRLDARTGTHPIITPIPDVFAAANAFDDITYQKGQAVIRMLESYVGEDVFRAGVRNYIARHAYGNTVTDDLWTELDHVSPKPVTAIAHDFTLQAGVPLIRAEPAPQGLRLTQGRFAADAASQTPHTWRTPVAVGGADGAVAWRGVVSANSPAVVPGAGERPAVVNAGQTAYFRTAYAPELWTPLAPRFAGLTPEDQLGLLYDSRALGEAGVAPMSRFLELTRYADPGLDPIVLQTLADELAAIDGYYQGLPGRDAYRAFARARLAPVFARVGWTPAPGEADNVALLRTSLIAALGEFDDPAVVAEARRRFAAYLKDPQSLTGSVRSTVLGIVAGHADATAWEQLHQLARASTDPTDKSRLYRRLGASHDPALADKALALALSGEPVATDAPAIISAVANVYPEKAFDFALAHRAAIEAMLEPTSRTSFFTGLGGRSHDPAMEQKLAAFAKTAPASSRGEADKAIAAVRVRIDVTTKRLPEVDRWLATHPG
ncbi:M1 family peptidase [Phenylobacterium hankyongense]|uniref:Aminopeptidase n=1 Tax=Phenylobacterium hankyongense TaxID=1813876 RepID=A0A328ATI0_9CAUL|nr:M1 family metallopeptidase [Phenylobacterium hankyongense]RAK58442.1 M1 family peptidase [Phenylobacterium hankyongense]